MTHTPLVIVAAAAISAAAFQSAARAGAQNPTAGAAEITFSRDIAPILNANCVTCHRPGAIAPFSLTSYEDAAPRAELIASVTGRRYMPPWKPVPGYGEFQGERRLSDAQISLIARWAAAGAPEGDRRDLPPPPSWPEGWQLGTPDLVVTMAEPFALPAEGEDIYRNFVIRVPIDDSRFVKAIELKPGTTPGLHHARIMIDRTSSARRIDEEDATPGYEGMRADQTQFPDGHFLGWSPGKLPTVVPDRLAWQLDPGPDLVLKAHLLPHGTAQPFQVTVGLFFSGTPPTETPVALHLGSMTIDIPAGAANHLVEDRYELPVDVDVLGVYPHAHFLGKAVDCVAMLPDGTERWLLKIDAWDFDWQDEYQFVRPVRLPKGSTVVMRFFFDNSAANSRNPSSPPRRVRFGQKSNDEMAEVTLQLLPADPATLPVLAHGAHMKMVDIALAGSEKLVADDPASAVNQETLGINLVSVGRLDTAVLHLQEAIRLDPTLASAHYNLGNVRMMQGNRDEALAQYRRAVEIKPDYAQAHNNLGGLFQLIGRDDEAAREYRLALQYDPAHPRARFNLGNLLLAYDNFPAAEAEFRQMAASVPRSAEAHAGLGRALAGQNRLAEAVESYRKAVGLDPEDAETFRNLGDALGRQGKQAEADEAIARADALDAKARP
jgi:tetratricopeptide (TPR) repeat protein/mono/diheme cytochrome c family protein